MVIRILTEDKITKIFCITDSFLRFFSRLYRKQAQEHHSGCICLCLSYISAANQFPRRYRGE